MNYFYDEYLIDLVYGLVFFLIGYSIVIVQPARVANCTLSRHLWLLAMFGIFHGFGEWARPLASLSGNSTIAPIADIIAPLFLITSFFFLLFFGVSLLKDFFPSKFISNGLPILLITLWFVLAAKSYNQNITVWFVTAKAWARYTLGSIGALLSSSAFLLHYFSSRKITCNRHRNRSSNVVVFGFLLVFFFYALFSMVGKFTPFYPSSILQSNNFQDYFGVPVEMVRTFFGAIILVFTLKTLNTFYIDHSNKLQSILKQQTINDAKSKISRDLHDVTIQSIYATGLGLKYTKRNLASSSNADITSELDSAIKGLNKTIKHLRFYITALEYPDFYKDGLRNTLEEIISEFETTNGIKCETIFEGTSEQDFPLVHLHQIAQIVKEALTNISKHAEATKVLIKVCFNEGHVEILVSDDGIGFAIENSLKNAENSSFKNEKSFGLKNMEERAKNIEAQVNVYSEAGLGTKVHLKVPFGGDKDGTNKVVNS